MMNTGMAIALNVSMAHQVVCVMIRVGAEIVPDVSMQILPENLRILVQLLIPEFVIQEKT